MHVYFRIRKLRETREKCDQYVCPYSTKYTQTNMPVDVKSLQVCLTRVCLMCQPYMAVFMNALDYIEG